MAGTDAAPADLTGHLRASLWGDAASGRRALSRRQGVYEGLGTSANPERMRNPPYVCALDAAMDVVEGKWKALILWALDERPHRFGELRRSLPGISEKVLAQQPRELEADGIVRRTVFDETPSRVEYELTDQGVQLYAALGPLGEWGVRRMRELDIVPTRGKEQAEA